jgi:sugar lactone lactonase YvrE
MRIQKFKLFSDEALSLINQTGVRQRFGLCNIDYPGCWDSKLSPDGILYYAPSDESGRARHTRLVAYDYKTDTAKLCYKVEDVALPKDRELPITKTHESISFLPDGRIITVTHSTDRSPRHPEWMPLAHHTHVWEGWPGSTILCYDPKTGKTENLGIPVSRESIYGTTYDAKHDALYMIGFMRGHVYRFSLKDRKIKDLGKAAELYCYRLHVGPDQHIYGCTKSGYLFRINVDTEELEDMNWRVPAYDGNYTNNTWYRYMSDAHNIDDRTFIFSSFCANEMFSFDTVTKKVTPIGRWLPFDDLYIDKYTTPAINEFAIDKYGVLWIPCAVYNIPRDLKDYRTYKLPDYLIRWDYLNNKDPELLGVIGTETYGHGQTSAASIDKENDILYLVDSGGDARGLSILCIDLEKYRPNMYKPGPVLQDKSFQPKEMTPEQKEAFIKKGHSTEETTASNPFYAFPIANITPVRIWRHVPHTNIEDSKIKGLVFDDRNVLHGICGDKNEYCFKVVDGQVETFIPTHEAEAGYLDWLRANAIPAKPELPEGLVLPHSAGRQYLASPTASIEWNNGRIIVGTADAQMAIISGKDVYALGPCATYGPVRSLCTNASKTKLWGTAGDDEDLGMVFYYDDKVGLRQLGFLIYNIHGYIDGPTASNILSCIALSSDETLIAVGGADRIGSIHIARI